MRLYVSGPMTGLPEHNYPTFAAATNALVDVGYDVSSPRGLIPLPRGESPREVGPTRKDANHE